MNMQATKIKDMPNPVLKPDLLRCESQQSIACEDISQLKLESDRNMNKDSRLLKMNNTQSQ